MEFISGEDFFEVRLASILTDYDRQIMTSLYQPIIGYGALSLFFTLWSNHEHQIVDILTHDYLFNLTQMTPHQFNASKKHLEAMGLMRTYFKKEANIRHFVYELYAPKMPYDFFNDTLFTGLLAKVIGEKNLRRLAQAFRSDREVDAHDEVTTSFIEVYHPDFNDAVFKQKLNVDAKGRGSAAIRTEFDIKQFFAVIEEKGYLKPNAFSNEEIKEVERLSALFGLNEETLATCVLETYENQGPVGKRLDFYQLQERCRQEVKYIFTGTVKQSKNKLLSSNSELAKMINYMEVEAPSQFLSRLQNGTPPAPADLKLINDLSANYHLTNGVINALIFMVLLKNNNTLSRAYTEKVASSLVREQIETALDATNYLKAVEKGMKRKDKEPKGKPTTAADGTSKNSEETDDEAVLAILKSMSGVKD